MRVSIAESKRRQNPCRAKKTLEGKVKVKTLKIKDKVT